MSLTGDIDDDIEAYDTADGDNGAVGFTAWKKDKGRSQDYSSITPLHWLQDHLSHEAFKCPNLRTFTFFFNLEIEQVWSQ